MSQTIREYLSTYLFNNGMFENQCEEVLQLAEKHDIFKGTMDNRWNDKIDDYPPMAMTTLKISLNRVALEYIEDKCPEAWFKPLFM